MNEQNKEIVWNVVNSLLSGALVLVGAFSAGNITMQSFITALLTATGVALVQFKDFWSTEKAEYSHIPLFKFL
jgi:hypothetical protein